MSADPRWVKVTSWDGPSPKAGDVLRSPRARYLVLEVEYHDGWGRLASRGRGLFPKRFRIVAAPKGQPAEGSVTHPWVWHRGRSRRKRFHDAS